MITAVALCALVLSCYGFFPPDIKSLRVPTHSIAYEHTTAGNSTWKYTVEHNDNVISMEFTPGLLKATCSGNFLFITFDNQTNAYGFMRHLIKGHVIVGGAHHGCINATTGKRSTIVRHIMTVPTLSQNTVSFGTKFAGITDVLKHAQASINVNPIELQAMASCNTADIIAGTCTTSLAGKQTLSGWNLPLTGVVIMSDPTSLLTCSNCYASFVPSINVNVGVANNALKSLELQVLGKATVQIQVTGTIKNGYSTSGSIPFGEPINLPSVTFFIGAFPVLLDFSIPLELEWEISAQGKIAVTTGVTVTDTLMGGVKYDGKSWKGEYSNNFKATYQKPTATVLAVASFKVGIVPKLDITFEYVATLGVGIKPYLEIEATASAVTGKFAGGVFAGIEVEVEGDLGVMIDGIPLGPSMTFGPRQVYDNRIALWEG
jgi:hypothetical protein